MEEKDKKRNLELENELFRSFENEERYEYARYIACQCLLDYENGEPIGWGETPRIFYDLQTDANKTVFIPRKSFDNNKTIQESIAAIGINPDKLWEALRFIRHLSNSKYVNAIPVYPSFGSEVERMIDFMKGEGATVRIQQPGKRSLTLSNNMKDFLVQLVEWYYAATKDDPFFSGQSVDFGKRVSLGEQRQIAYEADLIMDLLKHFSTDKDLPRRGKGQGPSRDKLLLTSRLLYLTKLTVNKKFREGKDSLHAVMRKCQNVSGTDSTSSEYLF